MNAGVVALAAIKISCATEVCRQTEVPLGRALDLVERYFPKADSNVPGSSREVVIQMGKVIAKAIAEVRKPPPKQLRSTEVKTNAWKDKS